MITVIVSNRLETQQLTHENGPIELGRGPKREKTPRLVIQDAFVSRDHLRITELPTRYIKIENLSNKAPVAIDNHSLLAPSATAEYPLPVRIGIGETVIDLEYASPEPVPDNHMHTINAPVRRDSHLALPNLLQNGNTLPVTELVSWLETVLMVQKATKPEEFYTLTGRALVDQIGLDAGLVLLHDGTAWRVVASASRSDRESGRAFSHTLLDRVLREKRTFFLSMASVASTESLMGVHSVVASPILDAREEVLGVVYGTRLIRSRNREIGPIEAQIVQLLASAVSVGLIRLDQELEAARLRVEKEAAEEADRTKSQFLAMVSHELRTPLTTIIGYTEMVMEQTAADNVPQYNDDLKQIHGSANHLLTLINDILDLSKIEAGKMELAREPFDPASLIRDLMISVDPLVKKNNNTLVLKVPQDLGRAIGDATRLRQCILNLVGNASKFTKDGTITVEAERIPEGATDWLSIAVTDTGIGMNDEQMSRLFQAFTQVDSSAGRKHGGTGLGLAISQKLCHAMHGNISVTSELDKGSTFTIRVPAIIAKA